MNNNYRHESGAFVILRRVNSTNKIKYIASIYVPYALRGRGLGSMLLKQVCSDADKEGFTLKLCIAADDDSFLDNEELVEWYKRHGFKLFSVFYYMRFPNQGKVNENQIGKRRIERLEGSQNGI